MPLALSVLFVNLVGIGVLTWAVMPPLTRVLDGWLRS
jgi:antibiotic biosynthesis monooxygenase (ABM) superfamily enzyme